jgi:thiazole/oxazole-forming peptide maturase SagD family component
VTRRFAAGWGVTAEAATAGCRNEIAERLSAQLHGGEPIMTAAVTNLPGTAVLPPEIMLLEEVPSAVAAETVERPVQFLQPDTAIGWIAADPAFSMQPGWIPAGLCFLGHDADRAAGLLPADSNGLAAGATREEAAIRGFLELIERDAVAIWWFNRLQRPAIDAAVFEDSLIAAYAGWMAGQDRVLRLIDLSNDLGIPVIAAISHDRVGGHIALGFGTGLDATVAVCHALGELTQVICNIALIGRRIAALEGTGQGESDLAPEVRHLWHWWRTARIADHPHLDSVQETVMPRAIAALDLAGCHDICRCHGLTFFAVDLTRDTIGVPVMRVIVPGLRPMVPRFAPGRLYDVPVNLGWLVRPLSPRDLNPLPLPY